MPETGPKLLLSLKRFPAILSKSRNTLRALGVSRSSASASSNSETRDTYSSSSLGSVGSTIIQSTALIPNFSASLQASKSALGV